MAHDHWFRFRNDSAIPVHVAVSTAGVIQWYHNDLPAVNGYAEVHMDDAIWHDMTVIPSNGSNQVNQVENNIWKGLEIAAGSLGVVAGAAAAPFTGGSSLAISVAVFGGLVAVGSTVVSVANFALHPATIGNLYAPDGYNFDIRGGKARGHHDDAKDQFVITAWDPISVDWQNNTSGTHGTVTG